MDRVEQRIQLGDFDTGDGSVTGEDRETGDEQQAPGVAAEDETATGGRCIFPSVGDTVERVRIIVAHHTAELPVQLLLVRATQFASMSRTWL